MVWPEPRSLSPGAVPRLLYAAPALVWSAGPQTLAVSSGTPSAGVGPSGRWQHPEKKIQNFHYVTHNLGILFIV